MNRYLHQLRRSNDRVSRRLNPFRETATDSSSGLIGSSILENTTVCNSEGLDFCVICQDDIFLEIVRKLSCKHAFHIKCIERWFTTTNICPICKRRY